MTATAASACCLGPVVFSFFGAGALGAATVALEPLRPIFLVMTAAFLAIGVGLVYRHPGAAACGSDGNCRPGVTNARMFSWLAAVVALLIAAFPYYMTWFV